MDLRITLLCAVVCWARPAHAVDATTSVTVYAFVDVNVVPMDRERVLHDQTVVIRGSRISEIGDSSAVVVPDGAMRIDGRGRFLMPGLSDMHAHIQSEDNLTLFAANGVTTIRNMFGGRKELDWRARTAEGTLFGPTIYTSGPILDGDPPFFESSPVLTTAEEARQEVLAEKAAGYDFLKVYPGLTAEVYDALMVEARKAELPVVGHVPVGLMHVLDAGQRSIEHLFGFEWALLPPGTDLEHHGFKDTIKAWTMVDLTGLPALVQRVKEAGTWICPTLIALQSFISEEEAQRRSSAPSMRFVLPEDRVGWQAFSGSLSDEVTQAATVGDSNRKAVVKALSDGGVRLLLGTDCVMPYVVWGFSIHAELANLVDAGLTPYQAFRSGTRDAAEFLGALDEFGTVSQGKRADLILLSANPLEDVGAAADPEGVMLRGAWYPRSALQSRLSELAAKRAQLDQHPQPHFPQ